MAVGFSIKLEGIESFEAGTKKLLAKAPELTARVLFTSAHAVLIPKIKERIRKNRSVFRGELFQKISAKVVASSIKLAAIDLGAIGVPHSRAVELGSAAHTPNAKKILEYVRKKLGRQGKLAHSTAAAIIATIKKKGTLPHPFLIPVWKANKTAFFKDTVKRLKVRLGT